MKKLLPLLPFFIIANIVYLDYLTIFNLNKDEVIVKEITPVKEDFVTKDEVEDIVRQATSSSVVKKETSLIGLQSSVKEFFVHLGSGASTANNWEDVPGVEAYIDTAKYGKIKTAFFEASLYTPTGNQTAYVRLYNVNDKYAVWPSELSIEGGQPKLLISQPMELPSGNKLYRVQMKTQLRARTELIQARVRIIVE